MFHTSQFHRLILQRLSSYETIKTVSHFLFHEKSFARTVETSFGTLLTSTAKLFSQFSYFSFRVHSNCLFQFNRKFVYSSRFAERQTMWRRCRHAHKKWRNYRMRREKKKLITNCIKTSFCATQIFSSNPNN